MQLKALKVHGFGFRVSEYRVHGLGSRLNKL